MNGLALCSGVGGLDLGLRLAEARYRCVCHVERDAFAASVLVARMADATLDQAPIWDDLETFDGRPWRGVVDIVVAGDPCQPNSVAGRKRGRGDDRWLLDQVLRVVEEVRPRYFFRENVAGNADGQLEVLVPTLERLGYRVAAGLFSAAEVGASHRRERLFVLGDAEGGRKQGDRPGEPEQGFPDRGSGGPMADALRVSGRQRPGRERVLGNGSPMADAEGGDGRGQFQPGQPARDRRSGPSRGGAGLGDPLGGGRGGRTKNPERGAVRGNAFERPSGDLPSFPPGPGDRAAWERVLAIDPTLEPALCRMADGMADRVDRLRCCGNGVVPLVAAYAFRTLDARLRADGPHPVLMEAAE